MLKCLRLIVSTFLFSSISARSAPHFSMLPWIELRPAAIQFEALKADEPIGRAFFAAVEKEVWLGGKSFIWKWSLIDGSVTRLDLPHSIAGSFSVLFASSRHVIGLDDRFAWELDLEKKSWHKFDGSFKDSCAKNYYDAMFLKSINILQILTPCGLYSLIVEPSQLISVSGPNSILELKKMASFEDRLGRNTVVSIRDSKLIELIIDGPRVTEKNLYNAKSNLLGVQADIKYIYTWTNQAIIVFDRTYTRVQVVPVVGNRKIKAFSVGETYHLVEFSDGTVELMDVTSQRKWATNAQGLLADKIEFSKDQTLIVFLSEAGIPRVFGLTQL